MNRLENNTWIILDLLQYQQDRAAAYEELLHYGNFDDEINRLLRRMATQCRNNILELRAHISNNTGSDPADHVEIRGEIQASSMNVDERKPPTFYHERIHIEA